MQLGQHQLYLPQNTNFKEMLILDSFKNVIVYQTATFFITQFFRTLFFQYGHRDIRHSKMSKSVQLLIKNKNAIQFWYMI